MSETTRRGFLGLAAATAGAGVALPVITVSGAFAAGADAPSPPVPEAVGAGAPPPTAGTEASGAGVVTRADHPNAEFAPDGWPGDHPEPLNAAVSCSLPEGFDTDGGEVLD
ncbi:twin-arginine translocation signal domain-containing protein [Streptomyces alkaliphilus]|uniref:twin-arginine translocation signal domain-containing protein n=1 Tax=Streptomyces alkaliphilus TaxID=1472722 RepID=UPI00117DC597|nr:twin-arginine translocation signal domain-containing protein [Streptomyces alkaliphilus]MQS08793.1 twin-arginine translocation signal domain-containing protein [Streptomyces alkaliphilus]